MLMQHLRSALVALAFAGALLVGCSGGSTNGGSSAAVAVDGDQAFLDYARCMRDHQIPMLDPDPTDGHISLGHVDGIANDIGRRDPQFQVADTACRSKLPAGVEDDGTGPP